MFRIRAEISREVVQTSAPVVETPEWCGMWENTGQTLKEFSAPIVWNFPPEQIQNPDEVGKYLKEKCNGSSKEKKLITVCWTLANAYHTLLDTVGQQMQPEREEYESAETSGTPAAAKPSGEPCNYPCTEKETHPN